MRSHCPALDRIAGPDAELIMKKVMLSADTEQYAEMVKEEVAVLRSRMGAACRITGRRGLTVIRCW